MVHADRLQLETMDDTVDLTFWVTGIVFVAVNLFMAYAICAIRHRKDASSARNTSPRTRSSSGG